MTKLLLIIFVYFSFAITLIVFKIPKTEKQVVSVRPDFILFMVLARSLILWDNIQVLIVVVQNNSFSPRILGFVVKWYWKITLRMRDLVNLLLITNPFLSLLE